MTQTIIVKPRALILGDPPMNTRRITHVGTLASARKVAQALWFPGYSVRIVTNRGTTWTLAHESGDFVWLHDTGRKARE